MAHLNITANGYLLTTMPDIADFHAHYYGSTFIPSIVAIKRPAHRTLQKLYPTGVSIALPGGYLQTG